MIAVVIALIMQSGAPTTSNGTPVAIARAFLEALATNPAAAKPMFTSDAVVATGDIGGPSNEFMEKVRPEASWMAGCRVVSLAQMPAPSEAEMKGDETPPWMKGGNVALVEGSYSCAASGGGKETKLQIFLVLKNERVAMLALGPIQTHAEKMDVPPLPANH